MDWQEIVSYVVGALTVAGGAAWVSFKGGAGWKALGLKYQILGEIIAAVIQALYHRYARGWKAKSVDGKLTAEQEARLMSSAKEMVVKSAVEHGLGDLPMISNDALLTGSIEEGVRKAKLGRRRLGLGRP